jgi:hypothetical protein
MAKVNVVREREGDMVAMLWSAFADRIKGLAADLGGAA